MKNEKKSKRLKMFKEKIKPKIEAKKPKEFSRDEIIDIKRSIKKIEKSLFILDKIQRGK